MNSEQINIEERLVKFLSEFKDEKGRIKYRDSIIELIAKEQKYLPIDFNDILKFDEELAIAITERPYDAINSARKAIYEILSTERPTETIDIEEIYAGFSGEAGYQIRLREVNSRYLNKLITINGLFIRCSQVYSFIEKAVFRCNTCGNEVKIEANPFSLSIDTPNFCHACGRRRRFRLASERTTYTDMQFARIQERPDELPPGQIPRFIDVIIKRPLVEAARPGDTVRVSGILSVKGDQVGKRRYHEFVIYVINIEALTKEAAEIKITRDEEEELLKLSADKNFYSNVIRSIAPSIYGLEIEKEALLLSLIGGKEKILPDGVKFRGNIHILLLGDPGTAKSELLKYASALAPKGLYTSGRGTTAAGLTAAVIKEAGGGLALEAGAVVLADMGTCAIDEIDKMRPEDRVALHEAMEQQSYHPSVEILLANGEKRPIGEIVDDLMDRNIHRIIKGKNCEILPLNGELEIYTVDLGTFEVEKIKVDRVSRHLAPDYFVEITYDNGRKILVTPEHPIFVWRDGKVKTIEAEAVRIGDIVPAPRIIPNNDSLMSLQPIHVNRVHGKVESEPDLLSDEIAELVGLIITEAGLCKNLTAEIMFFSSDEFIIDRFKKLVYDVFGLRPYIQIGRDGMVTLRYNSTRLYRWLSGNFSEACRKNTKKRVPTKIINSPRDVIASFMMGAFMGDGFVDSNDIGYKSTSRELIEDYQDLLLKLGIYSRIIHDEQNSSYKLCIERDSFITFRDYILKGNCEKVRRATRVIDECEKILGKNDPTSHRLDSLKAPPNIRLIGVRNVRKVENKGKVKTEWVYDVTVEPHHNFISHGLILHNTVSIAKGGIVATLNARTTIIAAANPKEGRYNRNRPPKDNIDLPVTLLSRFDLIFIIKDEPEVERDTKLVDHVLKTRQVRAGYPEALPRDFIRKYIAYAKRIDVAMTEEAMKKIKDYYLKMRMRSSEEDPVSISPRQLESLIRLSEAIARAKLKTRVEAEDAERATFLLQRFLSDVGIDIETGKIDIDMIYSGIPMKKRSKAAVVIDAIERMIRRYPDGEYAYRREVIDYIINHTNLSASDAESIIDKLVSEGVLFEPGEGRIAKVSR